MGVTSQIPKPKAIQSGNLPQLPEPAFQMGDKLFPAGVALESPL